MTSGNRRCRIFRFLFATFNSDHFFLSLQPSHLQLIADQDYAETTMSSHTLLSVFEPRRGASPTSPAVILPSSSETSGDRVVISYQKLHALVADVQFQLASFGLAPSQTVSSSLVNGIEFTTAFLATGAEQCVEAGITVDPRVKC